MCVVIILRWQSWTDLVYPLNPLVLHGVVGALTWRRPRQA